MLAFDLQRGLIYDKKWRLLAILFGELILKAGN